MIYTRKSWQVADVAVADATENSGVDNSYECANW